MITLIEAYNSFVYKNEIAFSSFCKEIKKMKVFKLPHRESDKCDHCELGKLLKKEITEALIDNSYTNQSSKSILEFEDLEVNKIDDFFKELSKNSPTNE